MARPKAVVLLSGGLDSATVLAVARADGYDVHALSFDYGQRHSVELGAAGRIATAHGVADHKVCIIDVEIFGQSALTTSIDVPKHESADQLSADHVPVTYVPARNTLFLSFALAYAESIGSNDIFIGVSAVDYSGYPDCRPEFIAAYEQMANLATQAAMGGSKVTVHAPLLQLTKAETVLLGTRLGVDYSLTSSCYDPDGAGVACGHCDACLLRLRGFAGAGVDDPITYQSSPRNRDDK